MLSLTPTLLGVLLDVLRDVGIREVVEHRELGGEAVGISRLGEELLRTLDVELVRHVALRQRPEHAHRHGALAHLAVVLHERGFQPLVVDEVAERLEELGIPEPRVVHVEHHVADAQARRRVQAHVRVLLERLEIGRVDVGCEVDVALLEEQALRSGLGDVAHDDALHRHLAAPVAVVAVERPSCPAGARCSRGRARGRRSASRATCCPGRRSASFFMTSLRSSTGRHAEVGEGEEEEVRSQGRVGAMVSVFASSTFTTGVHVVLA
jgi:hypothetical protein